MSGRRDERHALILGRQLSPLGLCCEQFKAP
jgi:hypothetical protein